MVVVVVMVVMAESGGLKFIILDKGINQSALICLSVEAICEFLCLAGMAVDRILIYSGSHADL